MQVMPGFAHGESYTDIVPKTLQIISYTSSVQEKAKQRPRRSPSFVVASVIFAILFLISAGLQLNDPDPLRWIALYTIAAVLSAGLPFRFELRWPAIIVGAIAASWCGYLLSHVVGLVGFADLFRKFHETGGVLEEAHEAGGTALVSLWLAISATIVGRIQKRQREST
jgi:hypothetical protein